MLAVGAGDNVVRLLPPLIIDEDEVREALKILSDDRGGIREEEEAA